MTMLIFIVLILLGISLYDYFDSKDWQHITCVDRINVVFEERNKKYGAYSIRRDYNDLVLFIVLGVFGLFGILSIVSFSIRIDPAEVKIPVVEMDTTLLTLNAPPEEMVKTLPTPYKIVGGGGASGTPSNDPFDRTPDPMVEKQKTQSKSDYGVKTGQGNKTTGDNTNNKASSSNPSPFSGSGGKNGGKGGGAFGNDEGTGSGNGSGPGSNGGHGGDVVRKLIVQPDFSGIRSDENCMIYLRVKIDANGNIVGTPQNDRDQTTTSNSVIIDEVIRRVKAQAKYNAAKGSKVIGVIMKCSVKAN